MSEISAAGICRWCGCTFRRPSDIMRHHCAGMQEAEVGPLLAARLEYEAENPRPDVLTRAERAIVRGLNAEGFGRQHQVTRPDRFEIAVDGLLIRVETLQEEER